MDLFEFENTSAQDAELVSKVVDLLSMAIEQHGSASLVVSGGRTPKGFFHLLSQEFLDWSKVTVTLADERWVDADHKDSNEKLVQENLLINEACIARFVPLKNSATSAQAGETSIDQDLSAIGRFTLVILGMGDDGHTASLFPGSEALNIGLDMESGRQCLAVQPLDAPHERMSMTLPRLLDSEQIIVHISGENKGKVLAMADAGDDRFELPIRAVLQQTITPVSVYWAK
jgi:6-phosphogluconolactonase|tara:strand:+ start:782 stop:1471 length:690 start_codon:yes stop_codon:yes gene_type:complete